MKPKRIASASSEDQQKPTPSKREPRAWEAEAMQHAKARYYKRRHRLEVSVKNEGGKPPDIGSMHSDIDGFTLHGLNAFGTTSAGFFRTELIRLCNAVCPSDLDEMRIDDALAVVDGMQPENEVESMLAVQMAATHALTMEMMARAMRSQHVSQIEMSANIGIKLMRTYTTQVEALAKLRKPPEQRVVVEHVHVHAGGQAVVGAVTHTGGTGGGVALENGRQAHGPDAGALAFAPGSPVWSENPEREPLPVAGSLGESPMPDARRRQGLRGTVRRSERELAARRPDAGDGGRKEGAPVPPGPATPAPHLDRDGGEDDGAA